MSQCHNRKSKFVIQSDHFHFFQRSERLFVLLKFPGNNHAIYYT